MEIALLSIPASPLSQR